MASTKNITMKEYNDVDYDTLYPKTIAEQVLTSEKTQNDLSLIPNANVDDAFQSVALKLKMITDGLAEISVTVVDNTGKPVVGVGVEGVNDLNGQEVKTNDNGIAKGLIQSGDKTIAIKKYIDITPISKTIKVVPGSTINESLSVTFINETTITSAKEFYFSPRILNYDACGVGGGGGGGSVGSMGGSSAGGGGGGYTVNALTQIPNLDNIYKVIIGSGGISGADGKYESGKKGGTTSLTLNGKNIINAEGGSGGGKASNVTGIAPGGSGGAGSGRGGNGAEEAGHDQEDGQSPYIYKFNDQSLGYAGGGGGGGGATSVPRPSKGGLPFGGDGGKNSDGDNGTGYGGGGGGSGSSNTKGGNGYQGVLFLRWRFKQ